MNVSSRTPEGLPSSCPICGAKNNLEFSDPGSDAICPNCGCRLIASNKLLHQVTGWFENMLGATPGSITGDMLLADLGDDPIDTAELVMMLEEEFGHQALHEPAEEIRTVADFVRYLLDNDVSDL